VDMASLSALGRLSKFLSEVLQGRGEAPIPLKQWEIAELLGVTPEHLSRLLKVLESKGLVRRGKNLLFVTNPQGLIALADTPHCPAGFTLALPKQIDLSHITANHRTEGP